MEGVQSLGWKLSSTTEGDKVKCSNGNATHVLKASYSEVLQSQHDSKLSGSSQILLSQPGTPKTLQSASVEKRNFFVVLYGIKECTKGTSRKLHVENDFKVASSSLSSMVPSINKHSVRDCYT